MDLIAGLFYPALENPILLAGDDAAVIRPTELGDGSNELAISTDAHVVTPLFFPGGDIGKLSVCGTVNDLSWSYAMSCSCRRQTSRSISPSFESAGWYPLVVRLSGSSMS